MSGIVALVGNPRSGSRTLAVAVEAAETLGRRLGHAAAPDLIDLAALGPQLLAVLPAPAVEVALELVAGADLVVVASPTYKGTYTGLLKAFLDRLRPDALAGAVALPLLVMGDPRHALAVEVHLRPLLVELGAVVPTPGLALVESDLPRLGEVLDGWYDRVIPQLGAAVQEAPATR
ncbi:NADPH-dependent FMN reductase [Nonomuraea cavernae]|uniref:FMN reductase n=1 Tax=Nonomuraea cavernae TaxID=2045107 RepID=A0A917YNS6_9ACTN|nr:NAD(P)H-dependent oxidoreductase [Nonomuraea cavernae]MCA2183678.1 NAD(P)H-dependent oxidoreductase [Nonomuraea cavernae]GGO61033.1 FMN reductase [Nonomuraea cavernae]